MSGCSALWQGDSEARVPPRQGTPLGNSSSRLCSTTRQRARGVPSAGGAMGVHWTQYCWGRVIGHWASATGHYRRRESEREWLNRCYKVDWFYWSHYIYLHNLHYEAIYQHYYIICLKTRGSSLKCAALFGALTTFTETGRLGGTYWVAPPTFTKEREMRNVKG